MRIRSYLLAAAAVLLLSVCDSDSTAPEPNIEGTFTLTTISGEPLPFTLVDDPELTVELVSGVIVMTAGRTFTDVTNFRVFEDGEETTEVDEFAGTYSINGNTITFAVTGGGGYTAQVNRSEGTITQNISGLVLIYER